MTYYKSYKRKRVAVDACWGDLFELLSSLDSPDVEDWLESRAQSGFTAEEFMHFMKNIDREEVQDWLWVHREDFMALMSRPAFNFANGAVIDSDNRWQRVFFLSPQKPGGGGELP
jgi:hypothetical protein